MDVILYSVWLWPIALLRSHFALNTFLLFLVYVIPDVSSTTTLYVDIVSKIIHIKRMNREKHKEITH